MGEGGHRVIVYLDQNYLSYVTRARLGWIAEGPGAQRWGRLYETLRELVEAGRAICPRSYFHAIEGELDDRLSGHLDETAAELSRGLHFRPWEEVVSAQAERALRRYLGLADDSEAWRDYFERDPQGAGSERKAAAEMPGPPQEEREAKKRYVEQALAARRERPEEPQTYERQVEAEKEVLIERWFGEPMRTSPERAGPLRELAEAFRRETGSSDPLADSRFAGFLASTELKQAPFIQVQAALSAASAVYSAERRPRESDLYDSAIVSLALPSCDIVTTDRYVRWLIAMAGLDALYGAEVYGGRAADVEAVGKRLAALLSQG
jgi:hypothetical protein